jgi:hypothetical protein
LWDCIAQYLPEHLLDEARNSLLPNPLFGDLIVSGMNHQALMNQNEGEAKRKKATANWDTSWSLASHTLGHTYDQHSN